MTFQERRRGRRASVCQFLAAPMEGMVSVDLLGLLTRFEALDDRESDTAWFRTRVSRESARYLNVIAKPVPWPDLARAADTLRIPDAFVRFLKVQNGASLFLQAFSLYGVHPPGQLFNRSDPYTFVGYDFESENHGHVPDRNRLVVVAGYAYDGSRVALDRANGDLTLWRKGKRLPIAWPDMDTFVRQEVDRLSSLHDPKGTPLCDRAATLPPGVPREPR